MSDQFPRKGGVGDREGLYWKESFDVEAGTVVVDPLRYQEEDNDE